jgi:hypothetical protein
VSRFWFQFLGFRVSGVRFGERFTGHKRKDPLVYQRLCVRRVLIEMFVGLRVQGLRLTGIPR